MDLPLEWWSQAERSPYKRAIFQHGLVAILKITSYYQGFSIRLKNKMADDSTWSQSSAAISNIGHVIHCVTIVTILKCKHGGDMRRWVYASLVDIGEHINLFLVWDREAI